MMVYEQLEQHELNGERPVIIPVTMERNSNIDASLILDSAFVRHVDMLVISNGDGLKKAVIKIDEPLVENNGTVHSEKLIGYTCIAYVNDAWVALMELSQNAALDDLFWKVICYKAFDDIKLTAKHLAQKQVIHIADV